MQIDLLLLHLNYQLTKTHGIFHFLGKQDNIQLSSESRWFWLVQRNDGDKPLEIWSRIIARSKFIYDIMTSGLLGACEDGGACDESWSWSVRVCSGSPTRSAFLCCRRAQIRKCFVRNSECDDVMLFVFALLSACVLCVCVIWQVSVSATQSFPERVKIVEVGPRDGLQNEKVKIFLFLNQPASKSSLSLFSVVEHFCFEVANCQLWWLNVKLDLGRYCQSCKYHGI